MENATRFGCVVVLVALLLVAPAYARQSKQPDPERGEPANLDDGWQSIPGCIPPAAGELQRAGAGRRGHRNTDARPPVVVPPEQILSQ